MYLNVKKGLDQLFLSQILEIVCAVASVLVALFGVLTIAAMFLSGGLTAVLGVFTAIFTIVLVGGSIAAFVLGLLGILNASKDEISYKNALVWLVVGIVASLLESALNNTSGFLWTLIKAILGAANGFASFMVMYSVINATVTVAQAIGNVEVFNLGNQRANSFKTLYIVAIILCFLAFIPVIGGILSLVGVIIELVIFFQYLGFLSKAKMMV